MHTLGTEHPDDSALIEKAQCPVLVMVRVMNRDHAASTFEDHLEDTSKLDDPGKFGKDTLIDMPFAQVLYDRVAHHEVE